MSQVKFKATQNNREVEVMGGWDNPLRSYHLTVFDLTPNVDDDLIWCQMDHVGFPKTLDPLKSALNKLGIEAPDGFWERCEVMEGNVFHIFENGAWFRTEI